MQPVLFDFNGTMFLDTDENIRAWREFIYQQTGYKVTAADFKQYINGVPDVDIIRHFLNQSFTNAEAQPYADGKETLYRQFCLEKNPCSWRRGCMTSWPQPRHRPRARPTPRPPRITLPPRPTGPWTAWLSARVRLWFC